MANRQKGESSLEIGGVTYTFRLTTAATAQLEDLCSTPDREMYLPEILGRVTCGSVKYLTRFIWACLLEHHPTITVDEVGKLIDEAGGALAFGGQVEAIGESTRPDPEDRKSDPLKAQSSGAGTGARSTSRRAKST